MSVMIVWVQSGTRCWIFVTAMAAGAAATAVEVYVGAAVTKFKAA